MQMQILAFIPALATIIWAICSKLKEQKRVEAAILVLCSFAVAGNGGILYVLQCGACFPQWPTFLRMVLSVTIVPLAYMYFAHQMGRSLSNNTTLQLWMIPLLLVFPKIVISLDGSDSADFGEISTPFMLYIIRGGEKVFSSYTANLVIMLQALLTMFRMIPMMNTMRKYGLTFRKKARVFMLWWVGAILFIAFTSFTNSGAMFSPAGSWIYFILYSALICCIYSMLALDFDLNPVVTKEEKKVVEIDAFVLQSRTMAENLKRMLREEKVFLIQGYRAEDAATALGTNRTYFARMMSSEFGMKFSEMLNKERLKWAQNLLLNSQASLSEIAIDSGFGDQSYMNRIFNQYCGMTAKQWKESR